MTKKDSQILLTKEGYKKLKEDLHHREKVLRKKLQDTLNQMRSQGDLSENDGYTIAVEDYQNNEEKILDIRDKLERGEIVEKKKVSVVELGCTVTIECNNGKKEERTYTIVGEDETNPLESKISYKSPIGASLMGKKKGSTLVIETPLEKKNCKIIAIK
jgi:transcription elongation factor GreA